MLDKTSKDGIRQGFIAAITTKIATLYLFPLLAGLVIVIVGWIENDLPWTFITTLAIITAAVVFTLVPMCLNAWLTWSERTSDENMLRFENITFPVASFVEHDGSPGVRLCIQIINSATFPMNVSLTDASFYLEKKDGTNRREMANDIAQEVISLPPSGFINLDTAEVLIGDLRGEKVIRGVAELGFAYGRKELMHTKKLTLGVFGVEQDNGARIFQHRQQRA